MTKASSNAAPTRRRLKLRGWIVTSAIAAFVLTATIVVMVGLLVSKRRQDTGKLQSTQLRDGNGDSVGAPIALTSDSSLLTSRAPKPAPSHRKPSSGGNSDSNTDETDSPVAAPMPTMQPSIAIAANLSTAQPSDLLILLEPENPTASPTELMTGVPTMFSVSIPETNSPARRKLTAFPTEEPTRQRSTSLPTRPPVLQRPVPASNPAIITFYVHADIPYNDSQAIVLEQQMNAVPDDAEFVVFIGDMRSAAPDKVCVKEEYEEVGALFRLSGAPVFSLVGDNDWSDCPNQDEGLQMWRDEFVGFESKYWSHSFIIKRHQDYSDTFTFEHKGVLFIGLNIVGGDVYDASEWRTRLTTQSEWTINLIREYYTSRSSVGRVVIFAHANPNERHNSFFLPLQSFISEELLNQLPIVYICGDKHAWYYEPNYYGQTSWLRIIVTGLGEEPLLKVTLQPTGTYDDPVNAFQIDRRLGRRKK
jgi:hypothetical protein